MNAAFVLNHNYPQIGGLTLSLTETCKHITPQPKNNAPGQHERKHVAPYRVQII
jgi:hypothetical protein